MESATPAAAASADSRTTIAVSVLKSSIQRCSICKPIAFSSEVGTGSREENASDKNALAAPGDADQEADAEREANGRDRTLHDCVLERFLQRLGHVLGGFHGGAALAAGFVHRRIHLRARLAV